MQHSTRPHTSRKKDHFCSTDLKSPHLIANTPNNCNRQPLAYAVCLQTVSRRRGFDGLCQLFFRRIVCQQLIDQHFNIHIDFHLICCPQWAAHISVCSEKCVNTPSLALYGCPFFTHYSSHWPFLARPFVFATNAAYAAQKVCPCEPRHLSKAETRNCLLYNFWAMKCPANSIFQPHV